MWMMRTGSAALPEVPTMTEAGIGGVAVPTWQGVYTAAKAPEAARARLATDIAAAVARHEMRNELERRMLASESATPQDMASTIARELTVWSSLIDEYKLTAD